MAGSQARRFEDVMRTSFPERFMEDRDLLHHLITVAPPSMLASQGAPPPRLTAVLDRYHSAPHALDVASVVLDVASERGVERLERHRRQL